MNIDLFKIPSGEITNLPYLRKIGGLGRPIILSTGMADIDEIRDAVNVLVQSGANKSDITILHCNTEYPTPMQDVNLHAMNTIKDTFDVSVGYSDHTLGIEIPIAAVALGATVIEKHFTLDNTMDGPDHKASLEPEELHAMVKGIRNIEKMWQLIMVDPERSFWKSISENAVRSLYNNENWWRILCGPEVLPVQGARSQCIRQAVTILDC